MIRTSRSRSLPYRAMLVAAAVFCAAPSLARAQTLAPERTLDELKAETLSRVERNGYPAIGLKVDDAKEALANIHSLDRDEWANAWSAIGDRYRSEAQKADGDAARKGFYQAFLYYSLGAVSDAEFTRQEGRL
jgi:hypothetical protein